MPLNVYQAIAHTLRCSSTCYSKTLFNDGEPVHVRDVALEQDFGVYPNPFNDRFVIDWKGTQQQKTIKLLLINVAGRVMYHTALQLSQGSNEIKLPELPAGSYMLLLQDSGGGTFSHKMVKN